MEFIVHKSNGRFSNLKAWKEHTVSLPNGSYKVKIESTKQRSLNQNSYYWTVVCELVYEGLRNAGFDSVRNKNDAHEIMKALFLKVVDEKNGIKIERVLSTRELTTVGFQEYIFNITVWAADYLLTAIPAPGQQLTIAEQ